MSEAGWWDTARQLAMFRGQVVKGTREAAGWSQQYLADRFGTTKADICRIENGCQIPSQSLARELAEWVLQRQQSAAMGSGGVRVPRTPSPARTSDPDTSHQAADSVNVFRAHKLQIAQLRWWQHCADNAVDLKYPRTDEGAQKFGKQQHREFEVRDSGFRTRRKSLVDAGLMQDSGDEAKLTSGRMAVVWEITDAGRQYLTEHDKADR